jgi:hypothetical protein
MMEINGWVVEDDKVQRKQLSREYHSSRKHLLWVLNVPNFKFKCSPRVEYS